jgi:MFS transporter, DHA1 family, multidrug resistance protein
MAPHSKPSPQSLVVTALLTVLIALGQISSAMYIPSMPSLVDTFSTMAERVNMTLTLFFVGFGFSQLIYGPLSDRFGRRRILFLGMSVFMIASLASALATSIEMLIVARFMQGVGACAGPVIGRAVVRDVYGRTHSAKVMAYIGVAFSLSPALTPTIGGYLHVWFGWQASFYFMTALAAWLIYSIWRILEETHQAESRVPLDLGAMARAFAMLLSSPHFLGYMISIAFIFGGLMAFVSAAPFVLIGHLGLSPDHFGLLSLITVFGTLAGNLIAGRFTMGLGTERMVLMGTCISLVAGILMAAIAFTGHLSIAAIMGPMTLFLTGMGIVMPNAFAGAMAPFPQVAGTASAMMGFFQMLTAAVVTTLAGRLPHDSQLPMALVITGLAVIAVIAFTLLVWRRRSVEAS